MKVRNNGDDNLESAVRNDGLAIENVSLLLQLSFVFISFGYMLPWTALGSLISYYKFNYGANFYVKIYCAYYLPGLPIALLQYRYDEYLDGVYGSKNTYMFRGVFSFTCSALILFSMLWFTTEMHLIALFTLLGICSWMCHGTASMMASMYPKAVIAYLQIGFRCPEIYIIGVNVFVDLGRDATIKGLDLFYKLTGLIVLLGLICWILVAGSNTSRLFFADKDKRMLADDPQERQPLIAKINSNNSSSSGKSGYEVGEVDDSRSAAEIRKSAAQESPYMGNTQQRQALYISQTKSPLGHARKLLSDIKAASQRDEMMFELMPLCGALILTIWGSIFQAAFFAYVESPNGRNIEQILYFTRLVCDLLGRPLTFLPRPWFVQVRRV